jgi:hypothetical protein
MKQFMILLCCLGSIHGGAGLVPTSTSTWNVVQSSKLLESVSWFQGDSWAREYLFTDGSLPVDLSETNTIIRWDLVPASTSYTPTLIITGTVVVATNGHISLGLTPAQSSISNQSYFGYVRAVVYDAETNVVRQRTLLKQAIEVLYSTGGL